MLIHLLITQLTAPNQTANHPCLLISFSRTAQPSLHLPLSRNQTQPSSYESRPIQTKSSTGPFLLLFFLESLPHVEEQHEHPEQQHEHNTHL